MEKPITEEDVIKIIGSKLFLQHWEGGSGSAIIQLKLGDKLIGKALRLNIDWKQDHGHGGGSYVNGITLDEI